MALGYSSKVTARPVLLAFNYAPGGVIPGAFAFTRASSAFETANNGTLVSKAVNAYRDNHYINGVRTLLLESAATNLSLVSNMSDASWLTFVLGADTLNESAGVDGTLNARRVAGSGTTAQVYRLQNLAVADYALSFFCMAMQTLSSVRMGAYGTPNSNDYSSPPYPNAFALTSGVWVRVKYARNMPTILSQFGWLARGGGFTTPDCRISMFQIEAGLIPSSPIVTAGVAASRSTDSLIINAGGTLYLKYIDYLGAVIETATPFISGSEIVAVQPRAYQSIKVGLGTYSLTEMRNAV